MPTQLEALRLHTVVVADTGDLEAIARYRPVDATTNPSLLLKAAQQPETADLVAAAVRGAGSVSGDSRARLDWFLDRLSVDVGLKILELIPGRVSTEVDARLAFDAAATVARAHRIVKFYEQAGIGRERLLIKIATTWEGVQAAAELEREGIHCNLTLLFSFAQAVACAEAGVTLISPFVGRIYDYWLKARGVKDLPVDDDPGVLGVRRIHDHFKRYGFATQVMGASFRKVEQVLALAGCDLLTISPDLLAQLEASSDPAPRLLMPAGAVETNRPPRLDERAFRWELNEDAMATEKLADGIRRFAADTRQLESNFAAVLA